MSAVPVTSSTSIAAPVRPVSLRVGLVLCLFLLLLGTLPAVLDFGLDGSGWDVVVIITAVLAPSITVATAVLVPFAWRGARGPSLAVALIQLSSALLAFPPFVLVFVDGLPVVTPIIALVGIALNVLAAWLVLRGMQRVA